MAAQREGERFPIADAHNDALLGLRAEDPVPRGQINLEGLAPGENNGVLEFEDNDIFTVTGYTPFTITVTESGPGSSGSGSDTESTEASEGSDGANDQAGSSAAEED